MALLVDATTAEHAVGIGVVINQFLDALAELPQTCLVAHGPANPVDPRLRSEAIAVARTPLGRLAFQRLALPLYAASRRLGNDRIDALLLLDAYMPHLPLRGLTCTSYVHDVLPLTAGAYWPTSQLLLKRAEFKALKHSSVRLAASTSHNADQIFETLGRRAKVVPYGCGQLRDRDADELLERGPGPRSSTILYIGALDARKNVTTLIEAFRSARAQLPADAELVVVGRPRDKGTEDILRALEDGRHFGVRHLASVSTAEALTMIDQAGAVVLPSSAEGFGLPLLEALASGTTAVAFDIPAIRSWAESSLIYARAGDTADLAQALVVALQQTESERRAGQTFAAQFRWTRFATGLVELAGAEPQHK